MAELKLNIGRLIIRVDYTALLFGVILLGLLICLGVWQVGRAHEKFNLNEQWLKRAQMPAITPEELLADSDSTQREYRLLAWEGQFHPKAYLLLNNRLYNGRLGYQVVALMGSSIGLVPVNLGWMPANAPYSRLPEPKLPEGIVYVSGRVHIPSKKVLFADKQLPPEQLPVSVETLYWKGWTETLGELMGTSVFPYLVQIDPQSPYALATEWQDPKQATAHHVGYAVQWFAMAALFLFIGVSRISNLWDLLRAKREAL